MYKEDLVLNNQQSSMFQTKSLSLYVCMYVCMYVYAFLTKSFVFFSFVRFFSSFSFFFNLIKYLSLSLSLLLHIFLIKFLSFIIVSSLL